MKLSLPSQLNCTESYDPVGHPAQVNWPVVGSVGLGANDAPVSWVLTAYLLSASVATPLIGRLGDMYGKERMLMLVLALLSAGTLMSAFATSLPLMLAGRVVIERNRELACFARSDRGYANGAFADGYAFALDCVCRGQV